MLVCHNGDRFRNRRGWLDGSGFVPYKLFGGECSQVFSCRKGLEDIDLADKADRGAVLIGMEAYRIRVHYLPDGVEAFGWNACSGHDDSCRCGDVDSENGTGKSDTPPFRRITSRFRRWSEQAKCQVEWDAQLIISCPLTGGAAAESERFRTRCAVRMRRQLIRDSIVIVAEPCCTLGLSMSWEAYGGTIYCSASGDHGAWPRGNTESGP